MNKYCGSSWNTWAKSLLVPVLFQRWEKIWHWPGMSIVWACATSTINHPCVHRKQLCYNHLSGIAQIPFVHSKRFHSWLFLHLPYRNRNQILSREYLSWLLHLHYYCLSSDPHHLLFRILLQPLVSFSLTLCTLCLHTSVLYKTRTWSWLCLLKAVMPVCCLQNKTLTLEQGVQDTSLPVSTPCQHACRHAFSLCIGFYWMLYGNKYGHSFCPGESMSVREE